MENSLIKSPMQYLDQATGTLRDLGITPTRPDLRISQVGHRSLQRQSHSSHQSVPQGQVWCFRNHGISVVLIQKWARGHRGFREGFVSSYTISTPAICANRRSRA